MRIRTFIAITSLALIASPGLAAVSATEAAQLGDRLTPVGAEQAANAAGTVPAWTGGIQKIPAGFVPGGHYPDPYAKEKPRFVIDGNNVEQYRDQLTPGQIALLKRYPTWKMRVFPTHRSARYPQGIYDETRANATKAKLVAGGNGITGASGGFPFPIPQNGLEAIWNHLTAYKGDTYATSWAQAAVTTGGDYSLVRFDHEYDFVYGNQRKPPAARAGNLLLHFLQIIKDPPRLAGSALLLYDFLDPTRQARQAWTYSPESRRVRLAPNVAYDNPGSTSDGLRTNDDLLMFNGATDRYDWKLLGKREIYIPYNAYEINGPQHRIQDILRVGHLNPDTTRYELHRVWVVEATRKAGASHLYKRRTFFLDEDSFVVHVQDKYDDRDQLWRVDELHSYTYYDVPFLAPGVETHHDLKSGRYLALSLRNEETQVYQPIERSPSDFTPDALRRTQAR